MSSAKEIIHKGIPAAELEAGGYRAVIAPGLGSAVMRLRDEERGMEIFRYREDVPVPQIMNAPEIWGLPALYLPNRLDGGVLKTSDGEYRFPVNEERFGNHLHGFVHKRAHTVEKLEARDDKAVCVTRYEYGGGDYFFGIFPLPFVWEIRFELSGEGLRHTVTLTNKSDKMLPVSIATHTTINAPFADGGKLEDIRLQLPAAEKINFDKSRWLPDGTRSPLTRTGMEYVKGSKVPVLRDICNDMFTAGTLDLDGRPFHGCVMTDTASGKKLFCETDEKYKFWIVWNDRGHKGYFCPEPMTAQVNAPNLAMPREESGYTELAPGEAFSVWQRFYCG